MNCEKEVKATSTTRVQDDSPNSVVEESDSDKLRQHRNQPPLLPVSIDPFTPAQAGHSLAWKNVSFSVKKKQILSDMSGVVKPKELCCILGHSGSGKTSLLNILSGKLQNQGKFHVQRTVWFDGVRVDPSSIKIRRKIAFVSQTDHVLATATPKEAIRFSARMRSPRDVSDEEVDILTERILEILRLEAVADSRIGNGVASSSHGLSGGELRRVSLGMELVVRPSIVFMDEVTSGLDSFNAATVMKVSKSVAENGAAVIMVIHQPTSKAFDLMDRVIFMCQGRTLYQGPGHQLEQYMEERSYNVPAHYNPIEWFMEISITKSLKELHDAGFGMNYPDDDLTLSNNNAKTLRGQHSSIIGNDETSTTRQRITIWKQAGLLFQREITIAVRDYHTTLLRNGTMMFGAVLVAVAYAGIGNDFLQDRQAFSSYVGGVFFTTLTVSFVTQLTLIDISQKTSMFTREYSSSHYHMAAYCLSTVLVEAIIILIPAAGFSVITYFGLGLTGRFWHWFVTTYVFALGCVALGMMVGSMFSDPEKALELVPVLLLPPALLSGVVVSPQEIPSWIVWSRWMFPYTYYNQLVMKELFSECSDLTEEEKLIVDCTRAAKNIFINEDLIESVYDDKSIMQSAQVGKVTGQDEIFEHSTLFLPGESNTISAFSTSCRLSGSSYLFVNQAEDNTCDITTAQVQQASYNPGQFVAESLDETWIQFVYGQRILYKYSTDLSSATIQTHSIYLSDSMLQHSYELFDSKKVSLFVCATMQEHCPSVFEFNNFTSLGQCQQTMETLPIVTINDRGTTSIDGNSLQCRNVHALLVRDFPTNCPYISFYPMEDSTGNIKCSNEEQNNLSSDDFFDESDYALFIRSAATVGLNTTEQYRKIKEDQIKECGSGFLDENAILASQQLPVNFACTEYLESRDATGEHDTIFWIILIMMCVLFRMTAFTLMRRRVTNSFS